MRNSSLLVFTVIGVCVLVSLGVWQLQRLTWKQGLISQVHTQQAFLPIAVSANPMMAFRRVYAIGSFNHKDELRLQGRTVNHTMGYYLFTPLILEDGHIIYVNRGWVARSVSEHVISRPEGVVRVEGVLRERMSRNFFTPANRYETKEIFSFDPQELAQNNLIPYYIDATHISRQGGHPKVMPQAINLRNHHLLYALTWFALAGGLVIICFMVMRDNR